MGSEWGNWFRDVAGTYAAVDAQKQIIKAQGATLPPPPTVSPGNDGQPVARPIDKRILIGGGVALVALLVYLAARKG